MSENNNDNKINIEISQFSYILQSNKQLFLKIIFIKNIIESIFLILLLSLCIMLLINGEFEDGYFQTLEENWNMYPIKNISLFDDSSNVLSINKKQKNVEQYILDTFYGIKDLKKYNERINIFIWGEKMFQIELFKNYSFKYLIENSVKKEGKRCGKDSEGFDIYFPLESICPLNYIEISNSKNPKITDINVSTFNLKNGLYIHLSRDNINGIILTKLKISNSTGPCYNYYYDSSFGLFFNEKYYSSKKKIGCEHDDAYNLNFKKLNSESLLNILQQNDINLKEEKDLDIFLENNGELFLFYTGYIGFNSSYSGNKKNIPKFIGKTLFIRNYLKYKNIALIAICLVFLIIIWVEGFAIQTTYLEKNFCSIILVISESAYIIMILLHFFLGFYNIYMTFIIKNKVLKYISIKYLWENFDNKPKFINLEISIIFLYIFILIVHLILLCYLYKLYKRHLVENNRQIKITPK